MIYIKTNNGWFSTGKTDIGQLPIRWDRHARVYYDSCKKDFCFPGYDGYYKSRGFRLSEIAKLKMWLGDESYPLFDEDKYIDLCKSKPRVASHKL